MPTNLDGTAGDDVLIGTGAQELIRGFGGNDLISGGRGLDTLDGGSGTDTVSYAYTSADMDIDLTAELATFFNGNTEEILNFENVIGSGGDNLITGDDGRNDIQGGAGDDTISGGLGRDTMDGGDGIDTIDFSYTSADVDLDLAAGLATFFNGVTEAMTNFENAVGTSGDNLITGTDGANILDGNGGNDTLDGGAGNDTLIGSEDGFTAYEGGAGTDTIDFSASTSDLIVRLVPDADDDVDGGEDSSGVFVRFESGLTQTGSIRNVENVLTGSGNDYIYTGVRYDGDRENYEGSYVDTGAGDDFIDIEIGGNDTVIAGDGDDYVSNYDSSHANGLGDSDVVFGGAGDDDVFLAYGNNSAFGESGNDTLEGIEDDYYGGADVFDGGAGDDLLFGGTGDDLLTGGSGSDTFEFRFHYDYNGKDTVTDFTQGEDLLVIDVDDENDIEITQDDGSTIITDGENSVTLVGFTGTLTADDLSFV
ncbi:calcium-binding protein [Pontivivens ytuae]|uniref:Calcium-binding protein n=1 Tax=Pontivivens ytuae TaxID=2789856 RepID=A0A7S9QDE2_9RHOB|nr:calcium-binding protein [Pontivivens ytuae]QPH54800.1 calcium-binding protein [Pontivivens ytuae]